MDPNYDDIFDDSLDNNGIFDDSLDNNDITNEPQCVLNQSNNNSQPLIQPNQSNSNSQPLVPNNLSLNNYQYTLNWFHERWYVPLGIVGFICITIVELITRHC